MTKLRSVFTDRYLLYRFVLQLIQMSTTKFLSNQPQLQKNMRTKEPSVWYVSFRNGDHGKYEVADTKVYSLNYITTRAFCLREAREINVDHAGNPRVTSVQFYTYGSPTYIVEVR